MKVEVALGGLRNWIFFNCVTCRRRHPLRVHCLVVITELGDCYDGGSRPKTIIKDVYPRKVDFRHEPALETLRWSLYFLRGRHHSEVPVRPKIIGNGTGNVLRFSHLPCFIYWRRHPRFKALSGRAMTDLEWIVKRTKDLGPLFVLLGRRWNDKKKSSSGSAAAANHFIRPIYTSA